MPRSVAVFGATLAALATLAFASIAPAKAQESAPPNTAILLVLAVDASGSVNQTRFELQRKGYADAFRNPRVLDAIRGGVTGSIAVTMTQWTGPAMHVLAVPWTLIKDAASANAFRFLEPRERAFARALAMAALRHLGPIDRALAGKLAKEPPPRVRKLLRLGATQAFFLDVPAFAAVATSVELAGANKASRPFKGLVNAVLRALTRDGAPAAEPQGLLARILKLRSRCNELGRKGANLEDLLPISAALDDLHKLVFGTAEGSAPGAPLAQQLMLADAIARGLTAGRAVLFVEIAFSGGSYRTRKWIFNTLFGRDGLSYSGGAGVTYFLFRADDRSTLDSDTLYFTSPHGRFEHGGSRQFQPTNLNR